MVYFVSNRYLKVMFKIPKMGHLPNPVANTSCGKPCPHTGPVNLPPSTRPQPRRNWREWNMSVKIWSEWWLISIAAVVSHTVLLQQWKHKQTITNCTYLRSVNIGGLCHSEIDPGERFTTPTTKLGSTQRHNGCFNSKSWSSMTWMMTGATPITSETASENTRLGISCLHPRCISQYLTQRLVKDGMEKNQKNT